MHIMGSFIEQLDGNMWRNLDEFRLCTWFRTNVTMEQWIEDNLDVGKVVSLRGSGTSGWSSQSEVTTSQGSKLFLKTCRQSDETMFKGEALGLQALYGKISLCSDVVPGDMCIVVCLCIIVQGFVHYSTK